MQYIDTFLKLAHAPPPVSFCLHFAKGLILVGLQS